MKLNDLEFYIPVEEVKEICKMANAQSVVLLDVDWKKYVDI